MKLAYITSSGIVDLTLGQAGLEWDDSIASAVIISLLTDRRAAPDDDLPTSDGRVLSISSDLKGWPGDVLSEEATDLIGSRLWLLARSKQTEETRKLAIFYAEESLQWLIDDGIAHTINIMAEWSTWERLDMKIEIYLIDGSLKNFSLSDITGVPIAI